MSDKLYTNIRFIDLKESKQIFNSLTIICVIKNACKRSFTWIGPTDISRFFNWISVVEEESPSIDTTHGWGLHSTTRRFCLCCIMRPRPIWPGNAMLRPCIMTCREHSTQPIYFVLGVSACGSKLSMGHIVASQQRGMTVQFKTRLYLWRFCALYLSNNHEPLNLASISVLSTWNNIITTWSNLYAHLCAIFILSGMSPDPQHVVDFKLPLKSPSKPSWCNKLWLQSTRINMDQLSFIDLGNSLGVKHTTSRVNPVKSSSHHQGTSG